MDCVVPFRFFVFRLLCVCWILTADASLTTYLFTRLQKTFSSCETKEEWPHPGLYSFNGRQIKLFRIK